MPRCGGGRPCSRPEIGRASRIRISGWTGVAAALVFALPGCAGESEPANPNVLLICLDAVRPDRMGCYGYDRRPTTPHLDELARRSIVFEDANAAACWTKPSVPSFLTGTWPLQHGVYEGSVHGQAGSFSDLLPEESRTLAEAFDGRGWATAAFVENDQLGKGSGIEQGFDTYEAGAGDARQIRWRALDWIDAQERGRPFFLYLHLLDAHGPYLVSEEFFRRFAPGAPLGPLGGTEWRAVRDAVNEGKLRLTEPEKEGLGALYDAAIRSMDDQLGLLFRGLERRGLWERTVVALVADHGEEFLERGRLGHGHGLHQTLLRVPWILRVPGREPDRVETPVSLVDLAPTILSAAGLRPRESMRGVDRVAKSEASGAIFAEHKDPDRYEQAYREGSWKLVRRFVLRAPGEPAGPAVPGAARLAAGARWQADLEVLPDGGLRAVELKPSGEPATEPTVLKGPVGRIGAASLEIGGVGVRLDPSATFSGEAPDKSDPRRSLREGMMVKASGALANGAFLAKKVKIYPLTEEREFEVRGTVAVVEASGERGRFRLDEGWIAWDPATAWGFPDSGVAQEALARERIAELFGEGGTGPGKAEFVVETSLYDLAADPGETHPVVDPDREKRLVEALDSFVRRLCRERIWGPEDRRLLDAGTIQRLKALGYVK
ncbi:MAG TPA: sulfatase-like hydrolase/transferase [Planctomycetota bacterium]|nr:sulfatase-like hydrolase/transferase [Planctomycetota bacterium]